MVMNDVTVRITTERVTHIMNSVLAEWVFVIYTKNSAGEFIFTGPYQIEFFSTDLIELVPNEQYPRADERPNIKIQQFDDGHDLATGLKDNSIDIAFHLPIDTLSGLRDTAGVKIKSFEVGYHYMMFYNIDTLSDVRVRRAIDVALDRNELTQALVGGTATRSLFPDCTSFYHDGSERHGNVGAAKLLLQEAGWTLDGNNRLVNAANEQIMSINLVAYPQRPGLVILQPVIAETLRDLGIAVTEKVTTQEWDTTQQILDDRSFDLILWAQHTLPAGDPFWFLNTFFHSGGGSNYANLQSVAVDNQLDLLSVAETHDTRILLSQATQEAIREKVPVSNLVTPFWHVGLSQRLADYDPWGADYYIVRGDLFLAGSDTEVPPTGDTSSGVRNTAYFYAPMTAVTALVLFLLN